MTEIKRDITRGVSVGGPFHCRTDRIVALDFETVSGDRVGHHDRCGHLAADDGRAKTPLGKRALAVTVMTLLLLCVLVVPLIFYIGTIVSNVDESVVWVKSLASFETPSALQWVADLPLIGPKAVEIWEHVAAAGIQEAAVRAMPRAL